jgi:hypothetical protein
MFHSLGARLRTAILALLAIALASPAIAGAAHQDGERVVVRGDATIQDAPCPGGLCLELTGGSFRGTLGTGAYGGSLQLMLSDAFPNGEGGACAPIRGKITLGEGTKDRLVLAVDGDSCQDGEGDVTKASFTGVATWRVKHGTGVYTKARGHGLATFLEDAADNDRMTLVGRITR